MEILVVSDTHGRADRLAATVARTGARTLFFLGDGLRDLAACGALDLYAVRGNCDRTCDAEVYGAPAERLEILCGIRFFLTHGHRYDVSRGIEAAVCAAADADADVLCYGHTHIPFERTIPAGTPIGGRVLAKSMQVLCPGSLGSPRGGSDASFATLTLPGAGVLVGFGTY